MTTEYAHVPTPELLRVVVLRDAVVEDHGYPVASCYAETFWLPVVGPTAMWLLRRLAAVAGDQETRVPMSPLAAALGLSPGLGSNAAITRALHRIERFSAGRRHGDLLQVRTHLAQVPQALMRRWPPFLLAQHVHEVERPARRKAAHAAS